MKFKDLKTGTKLALSFGLIIFLTLAIVLVSVYSLNEIEEKSTSYNIVLNAQKDFLIANSCMEAYLNEKDSVQYLNCSVYIDSATHSLVELKSRLKGKYLPMIDGLIIKLTYYKDLMQQNHDAIEAQKEIYGDRRKMRIIFTDLTEKYNISRHHDVIYYFNRGRLYAVYLLSSNDSLYYNEVVRYIDLALEEARKINNRPIIEALEDYMVSVTENYDLALKIRDVKNAQIVLGKEILEKSGNMINHIEAYQEKVRESTKISMLIFSIITIVISIVISRIIVVHMTNKQQIIEQKNEELIKQAELLGENNALLEERQQQIEEQSEEIMAHRDQLSKLNATKDKLFSILAHDLKNPFNTILGFSELLLIKIRNYPLEKIEYQVKLIRNSTKYAYNLLENLLQWSRSQRGIISFEPEIIRISEYVDNELKSLRQQAISKEITIEEKTENDEKIIEADPNMISIVVRNLISNAIKFSHKGSKIDIKLQFTDDAFIFSVKDRGTGMTEEKKNQLFKVIENISTSGTDGEKGTGLGLLVCADFIEKHKGNIVVESEENVGSTFSFSIPYVQK
ncbi:MAG: HAMP domain-containing histidine kinase [Bacteroidales bacterium]|nr:HAMP domain-containing histidine kinase [Bacteroidales bacterium]